MRAGLVVLSSIAAIAFGAGPAFSADIVDTCPSTWTGVYAGIHAGYAFGDGDTALGDVDLDGFIGGGLAGFNYQTCSVVIGLEGDVGFSPDIDGSTGVPGVDLDVEPNGHIRARLGLDMDGTWMPFIAGGLAIADADIGGDSKVHLGFSIGAGVDYRFTDNLVGRIEYLFDSYEQRDYGPIVGDVDFDTHTVRAAISWQF
jgi:outer membrane immunogenic protein